MKKILTPLLLLGVIGVGIFFFSKKDFAYAPIIALEQGLASVREPKKVEPITLVFAGDVMFDRGVKRNVDRHLQGDFGGLFANTPYLQTADIAFLNLEGPVATGGRNVGSIYSFRMDPIVLGALKNAGIDIVSFANNHVGDYSKVAFDETLENLSTAGILYTGAGKDYREASTPKILEVRGQKIGFLGFTDVGPTWLVAKENISGTILATDKNIDSIIQSAKEQVDLLIVSFHFGDEYSPVNARQERIAKNAIDNGADIIVGHHPHVMQKMDEYKGKPIFYSLGNFIFDQYFSEHTMRGMIGMVSYNPETKGLTASAMVSPLSKQFVPQEAIPFDENMLLTKSFTP